MTRTPRAHASAFRRLMVGTAAAAATLTIAMAAPATASAATKATSSVTIGSEANHALWLLAHWQETGTTADFDNYLVARARAAQVTAAELGVSAAELDQAWGKASVENQRVVLSAMSQLGVPYRSRMSKENRGFDCSGLVAYAYANAGIALPRSSREQIRAADEVDPLDVDPGDLVYYPGHISLFLGAGLIIHSPQSGKRVEVRPLFDRSLRFGDAIPDGPHGP